LDRHPRSHSARRGLYLPKRSTRQAAHRVPSLGNLARPHERALGAFTRSCVALTGRWTAWPGMVAASPSHNPGTAYAHPGPGGCWRRSVGACSCPRRSPQPQLAAAPRPADSVHAAHQGWSHPPHRKRHRPAVPKPNTPRPPGTDDTPSSLPQPAAPLPNLTRLGKKVPGPHHGTQPARSSAGPSVASSVSCVAPSHPSNQLKFLPTATAIRVGALTCCYWPTAVNAFHSRSPPLNRITRRDKSQVQLSNVLIPHHRPRTTP
jgi:hypothetical protein